MTPQEGGGAALGAPGRLQYRLLGPLEVASGASVVEIGSRLQRLLVLRLLIEHGRPISADRLIEDLWRGEPPPAALAALHALVSKLRRVLEPARASRQPAARLVTRPPGYALRTDDDERDDVEAGLLVERARSALASGDLGAAADLAAAAADLWRGPALADAIDEPWAAIESGRLSELVVSAQELRAAALILGGGASRAVGDLDALIERHPFREGAWVLAIAARFFAGRAADALRAYQRVRASFVEELGFEPGEALRRVEAAVLARDADAVRDLVLPVELTGRARPARSTPSLPADGPAAPHGPRRSIVGRAEVLAAIAAARAEARLFGAPRWVLLTGEAGMGKSTVAGAAAAEAAGDGWCTMAWARGDEEERPAFGLFTRGLLGAPTAPSWPALFESASGAAGEDRTALFTRVAQSLGEVLARQPTVAVLDDVQWADADSLALVRHLVLHVRSGPLLVLLTVRDGEDSRLLSPLLAALAREAALRLSLAPLGRSEVAELAARRGEGHSPEAIDVVFQRSGGNPFFAAELLRLAEPELLSGALPPNVQDVLRLRLARLSVEAVEALRALAVIGGAAELDLLAAAVGDAPAAVYERLDQAIEADVIKVRQDATLEFRHALLRDAVLAEVTSFQRHRWHLKVAEVSAALPGRRLAERAHHLVSAGPLAGAEEVIEAAIAAAGAARQQGAYLEARRWWEVADRRAAAGNVPVELRAAAAYGLGASQAALGDPGAGRLKLAEAVAWFLDLGDLAAVAATCRHWNAGDWTFLLSAPQDRRIMAPLERAAAATANEAVEVRAPVLFAETVARYDRLAPAELLARGRQLAGLAAAGRDAGRWAAETAANAVALLLSTGHEPHALEAHARLRDALEAWAEADGHTFSRARCAMDARASMLEFCQRLALGGGEACRAAFERALALASTVELDPATNVLAGYTMVTALSLAGDFAGAAAHLQEVAERHERSGIRGVRAYRASSQLQIAFASGHLERAAGELAVLARSRNAHARAIAALIERQPERARAILADEPFGLGRRDWLMLLSLRAEVALAADASDDLVRLVPLLERWRDRTPALPMAQQCLAPIALTLGRARLALDQPAAAVDALEPAQRIASTCGSPVWEARAGWFLAAARHRSGAGDETDQQASAAQRTAARLGMRLEPGA